MTKQGKKCAWLNDFLKRWRENIAACCIICRIDL